MITCVIIGFAHMHVNEIARYITDQPDTRLLAVADVEPKRPELTDKRYTRAWNLENVVSLTGVPVYADYRAMLEELRPDYAYILCENAAKPDAAGACAARGVTPIIEKPMAADLAGAQRIASLKDAYGVEPLINWPVAWRPYLYDFKAALDAKICGEPVRLRYINGHTGPLGKGAKHRGVADSAEEMSDAERANIWWYQQDTGGGARLDILCYGCYFARWLFGRMPDSVTALGMNLGTPYSECEDNVAALFRYGDKMVTAEGSWTIPRRLIPAGPQMLCRDGAVWCAGGADSGQRAEACTLAGEEIAVSPADIDPDRIRNMPWHIACHENKGTPVAEMLTANFNLDVMRMLDAALRSDVMHREIKP